jgi:DNA polymerase (family X)
MDNYTIAEHFSLLSKLIDIHGDNSFKAKTYSIAAYNIEKLPLQLKDTPREKLAGIKGIGDSTGKKVIELLDTGKLTALTEYIDNTPPGVIELLNIKGIGPKKINTIWKEMGVESIGELLYACNENRLTLYKGFGQKTQQNVQEAIEFYLLNQGHFLYAQLEPIIPQVDGYLKKLFGEKNVHITGRYRRQELTIEELEYVVTEPNAIVKQAFETAQPPELLEETNNSLLYKLKNGLKLRLYTGGNNLAEQLFTTTGAEEFLSAFKKAFPKIKYDVVAENDEVIFQQAKIPYIQPCLRETAAIIQQAQKNTLPHLIEPADVKGIIHSHSNWSDGSNTIEEMATECIKRGLEYLVISDHSQTASYANGLKEDRLKEQHTK